MATLTNTKIKDTYKSLLKVSDNGNLEVGLQEITDGEGNASGVQLNTGGDLTASGTVAFGSLKDSGENITIAKFVDEADGIALNDNDTSIPTSAAVKDYVDTKVTAEDLDFAGDSGTGAVDLDSQTFTISGTANEVVTSASGQTITIGLPTSISVDVVGDLTGNVTATSVLADGVTATTQSAGDNSTKVATTAYVDSIVTAQDLDFAGDSGTGAVDLDSQSLTIAGTANEIETSASGQTITIGLPSSVTVGTLNATTLGGTLSTAAQPNITSVGTLTGLNLSDDIIINKATGATDITIRSQDGSNTSVLFGDSADNNTGRVVYDHSADEMQFWTNDNQQTVIDSSGNVGIGTSSPLGTTHIKSGVSGHTGSLNANYDDLAIEGSGNTGITILTPNNNNAGIAFSDEDAEVQGLILYSHSDNSMEFRTNSNAQLEINNVGNAFFSNGIFLNGETVGANKLDDYEEGTFTPELADAETGGNVASYASEDGIYTKVGRLVTINLVFNNIDTTGMTAGNNIYIRNLPFTPLNTSVSEIFVGSMEASALSFSGILAPRLRDGDTFIRIFSFSSGGNASGLNISDISSGTCDIRMTMTYFT